jgi:hypothetical protein
MAGLWIAACSGSSATTGPLASATAVPATQAALATGVGTPAASLAATAATPAPSVASTPTEPATSTPAATVTLPTPSPAPTQAKGPASGKLASTGTKGLTVAVTVTTVDCNLPTPGGGLQIFVLGQFGTGGPGLNMHISAGTLSVDVDTGAGTQFHSRSFSGSGLTSFDAAVGAQIDSQLTEITPSGNNTAGIGKLTSLSGSIDCGNQVPGTSTLILTGTTPDGLINGPLDPVRVGCNTSKQYGKNVQASGVVSIGTTRVTAIVNVTANYGFSVFLSGSGVAQYSFTSKDPAVASIVEGGAQISGDLAGGVAAGEGAPLTIHVVGAMACGTTTAGP